MLWEKIKGFFKKKPVKYNLDEEARLRSAETRKLQAEIAQIRRQVDMKSELQQMRELLAGDLDGSKSNSLEEQFLNVLMGKLGNIAPQQQQDLSTSTSTMLGSSDKDTELKAIAEKVAAVVPSQYLTVVQNYSDEELIKIKNFMFEVKKGV